MLHGKGVHRLALDPDKVGRQHKRECGGGRSGRACEERDDGSGPRRTELVGTGAVCRARRLWSGERGPVRRRDRKWRGERRGTSTFSRSEPLAVGARPSVTAGHPFSPLQDGAACLRRHCHAIRGRRRGGRRPSSSSSRLRFLNPPGPGENGKVGERRCRSIIRSAHRLGSDLLRCAV